MVSRVIIVIEIHRKCNGLQIFIGKWPNNVTSRFENP